MAKLTPPPEPLSDGVVSLRPWRLADASAVAAACQDPEIQRWTRVPSPYSDADACEWLESQPRRWLNGESAEFAVVDAVSGDVLACVGLVDIEWDDRRAEIGYWVVAGARRRGVARRAVLLLCDWAFREVDLIRLEILAEAENQVLAAAIARYAAFINLPLG